MNTAVLNKAELILAEAHAGSGAAMPSGFLKILLDLLMGLLGGCTGSGGTPASILKLARSTNPKDKRAVELLTERSIRRDLRARYGLGGYARHDGDKIVSSFLKTATLKDENDEYKVSEEDVADLVQLV